MLLRAKTFRLSDFPRSRRKKRWVVTFVMKHEQKEVMSRLLFSCYILAKLCQRLKGNFKAQFQDLLMWRIRSPRRRSPALPAELCDKSDVGGRTYLGCGGFVRYSRRLISETSLPSRSDCNSWETIRFWGFRNCTRLNMNDDGASFFLSA